MSVEPVVFSIVMNAYILMLRNFHEEPLFQMKIKRFTFLETSGFQVLLVLLLVLF